MIDVIIPCYNAEDTLQRAVQSVLTQAELGTLWLIDDQSTDQTFLLAQKLQLLAPEKICIEQMPKNSGVAKVRNWGALQSKAEFIAFLDADDAYEPNALSVAQGIFQFRPEASLVRLALKPINLAERYANHPEFNRAWQYMRMTCGGNTVFRRSFFLACGGFPQDDLFREFGGEDGALGIATTKISYVATAFNDPGVLHFCREGMHAEYLLNAALFNQFREGITPEKMAQADKVTEHICNQISQLTHCLSDSNIGIHPLVLEWK